MVPIRFETGRSLWGWLTKLARNSKGRRLVAVPYVSTGGARLIPLRSNDVLVTSLTEGNSRAGLVDPREIASLQCRGVHVYSRPDLHAKVYLLGKHALVTSANLSRYSKAFLEEAGVIVSDRMVVARIREWFSSLSTQEVTPALLELCRSAYRPPRFPQSRVKRGRKSRPILRIPPPQRVWLVSFDWYKKLPKGEMAVEKKGVAAARQQMGRKQGYTILTWRSEGKSRFTDLIESGQRLIPIELHDRRPSWVWPHELVHQVRSIRTKSGIVYHLYVESPSHARRVRWRRFVRQARAAGLRISGQSLWTREIRDPMVAQAILRLVVPRAKA